VTGELEKATQTLQERIESYPRNYVPHLNLGIVYTLQGSMRRPARSIVKASASPRMITPHM
jgi:hypothetical protein